MADTDFGAFTDVASLDPADVLLLLRGAGGINAPASLLVYKASDGRFKAGAGMDVAGSVIATGNIFNTAGFAQFGGGAIGGGSGAGTIIGYSSGVGLIAAFDWSTLHKPLNIDVASLTVRIVSSEVAVFNSSGLLAGIDNTYTNGGPSNRWAVFYAATGTINTSDERDKVEIGGFPDEWLDAWGDVEWVRYKFADAVEKKGDAARWHAGLIAQRVHATFEAHDLDAFAIGLCCFDEWEATPEKPAEPEVCDAEGNVVLPARAAEPARPAGNRWGLRYTECFAMEAAYQRRRMAAIEARLAALEAAA